MSRTIAALALLVTALACGSDEPGDPDGTARAQGARGLPNIVITQPRNGVKLKAGDVKVKVEVTSFEIAESRRSAKDGEGFIYYYMDVETIPTSPGRPATAQDSARDKATTKTSYAWKDVEPGSHTFSVQLVDHKGSPLDPPITSQTAVTVVE